jgi:hypothetical protein
MKKYGMDLQWLNFMHNNDSKGAAGLVKKWLVELPFPQNDMDHPQGHQRILGTPTANSATPSKCKYA